MGSVIDGKQRGVIVTDTGLASDAPNSLRSTAACKSKDCLSGRPLKSLIFPGPRCKRGALGRIGSMRVHLWSNSLRAFPVLPSCIVWCSRYMWCLSQSVPVALDITMTQDETWTGGPLPGRH